MSEQDVPEGAAVPVAAVVTGEQIMKVRQSMLFRAYRTAASSDGKMQLTRTFRATIQGFNAEYGVTPRCRTWAQVRAVIKEMEGR